MIVRSMLLVAAAISVFGCSAATESGDEGASVTSGALAGGCRWICPKCKPGAVCSKIACFQDCNAAQPCGDSKCAQGQYCCNASCGICAGPDEFCTMQACEPKPKGHTCTVIALCIAGYHWSSTKCTCLPDGGGKKPGTCTTDADCRLEADYCTGCNCSALASSESLPVCSGPGVRCFADPCMGHTAACVGGTCSVN